MQKNFISLLVIAGLLSLAFACQNNKISQTIDLQQEYNISAKKSKSNWYENLPTELKEYYAPAQGKVGLELFNSLHDIISANQKVESYTKSREFLFSTVDNISNKRKQSGVLDAYSQVFIPGFGEFGESYREVGDANKDGLPEDTINAEHTWPQSFYGKSLPMVSDLHAIQTVLSMPNVMRSDFPFGEVNKDITYTTVCGSKLSILNNDGKLLSYSKLKALTEKLKRKKDIEPSLPNDEYKGVFEPCNAQKGNTARNLLYFYLRYYDMSIQQGSYENEAFWKTKVKIFIDWSEKVDPVDEREKIRSEIIYNKQGNRNPFVDIPELASIIGQDVFLK